MRRCVDHCGTAAAIVARALRSAGRNCPTVITFRCTQKARTLLGLSDRDLSDATEGDLYEWFVDLATIDRHRCNNLPTDRQRARTGPRRRPSLGCQAPDSRSSACTVA